MVVDIQEVLDLDDVDADDNDYYVDVDVDDVNNYLLLLSCYDADAVGYDDADVDVDVVSNYYYDDVDTKKCN